MSPVTLRALIVIAASVIGLLAMLVGAYLADAGQITRDQAFIVPLLCVAIGLIVCILDVTLEYKGRNHG